MLKIFLLGFRQSHTLLLLRFAPHKVCRVHQPYRQGGQRSRAAQGKAVGLIHKVDAACARRAEHRHQSLVHTQDVGLFAVDIGGKAVIVGHGEKDEVLFSSVISAWKPALFIWNTEQLWARRSAQSCV